MALDEVEVSLRQGTTAQWAASGLVLQAGELGYDTTTDILKVGDGAALFAALPVLGGTGATQSAAYTALEARVDALEA